MKMTEIETATAMITTTASMFSTSINSIQTVILLEMCVTTVGLFQTKTKSIPMEMEWEMFVNHH